MTDLGTTHNKRTRRQQVVALRNRVSSEQNHRCCYCGVRTNDPAGPKQEATLEHLIPRSQGGGNGYANCVMACFACNQSRADHFDPAHFEALGVVT